MLSLVNLTDEQRDELMRMARGLVSNLTGTMEHHRAQMVRRTAAEERKVDQLARIADAMEQRNNLLNT